MTNSKRIKVSAFENFKPNHFTSPILIIIQNQLQKPLK